METKIVTPGSTVLFDGYRYETGATEFLLNGMDHGASYAIQLEFLPEECSGLLLDCRSNEQSVFTLIMEDDGIEKKLTFTFHTHGESMPFSLVSPIGPANATKANELIVWVSDVRAVMIIDGKLTDEEWPLGEAACTIPMTLAAGPAVRDAVICSYQSPGEAADFQPKDEGGSGSSGLQYWKPEGNNTGVGDCMPFWHDGVFHLFYLFDRRAHKSKHGLGAHQWAHASSLDLIHWTHHEMAIPISEQWEGSICTGSVFFNGGVYYAYYAVRMSDLSSARLSVSTSGDGNHFHKAPPLTALQAPYDGPSARDPMVFQDDEGHFHMLVTTSLKSFPIKTYEGCLAHLTSDDLFHWEQQPPFIIPGYTDQPECSDCFFWNGWYYLVFSSSGAAHYRMSRHYNGPWVKPADDMLNCPNVAVPKTAEFKDGRRISVGFLRDGEYAGRTVFREIFQNPDGTLCSSFVPEMLPMGETCAYDISPITGDIDIRDNAVAIHSSQGFAAAVITGAPINKRIMLTIVPGDGAFGVCLKSDIQYDRGTELRFEPARRKAGFRRFNEPLFEENSHNAIWNVEGLDQPFVLDIIVTDALIDVCINGSRTLITKSAGRDTSAVCLFANWGNAAFQDIRIIPLS